MALTNYVLGDLSLESHVQAFANLLNSCLKTPHDDAARLALNVYSTFQSVPKVRRRLNRSFLLKALPRIDSAVLGSSASVHEPTFTDRTIIEIILLQNGNCAGLHPELYRYLYSADLTPVGYLFSLPGFLWFLKIVCEEVETINKLRRLQRAPQNFFPKCDNHPSLQEFGEYAVLCLGVWIFRLLYRKLTLGRSSASGRMPQRKVLRQKF